jgi:hypothetical protein
MLDVDVLFGFALLSYKQLSLFIILLKTSTKWVKLEPSKIHFYFKLNVQKNHLKTDLV